MRRKQYTELFELFWENSKLDDKSIRDFKEKIDEYYSLDKSSASLLFPGSDKKLKLPNDPLYKLMKSRKSTRVFSSRPIDEKKLGRLFASFSKSDHGTRTFASAGSTYSLEVFAVLNSVKGSLNKKVVYYNHDNHSLSELGDAPRQYELDGLINLDTGGTIPPIVFIFTLMSDRTTVKYGERGGRFALIELGHAVQNLALRIEKEKMAGVEIGGLMDGQVLGLLKLKDYPLKVVLGYACGYTSK